MKKYDVVIIGSGIGGLVCGCYLAKAGLKTLIVEQHTSPGGCCASFVRQEYIFDVGVHYIGSCREGGVLPKVFHELDILDKLSILTCDPTDKIIVPDKCIYIRKDSRKTKAELVAHFPREKNSIDRFYSFIRQANFLELVARLKTATFSDLLNDFFYDEKLKAVLSVPLGNLGISPRRASALVSAILYEEYIFDGGYYPRGGAQVIPNMLVDEFVRAGGELLLSTRATRILTKDGRVVGVEVGEKGRVSSGIVVSNADAALTFNELLDCRSQEGHRVNQMTPSPSAFVIYLGLKHRINNNPKHFTTWFFNTYDVNSCYENRLDLLASKQIDYVLCTFPAHIDESLCPLTRDIVRLFVGANFDRGIDSRANKQLLFNKVVEQASRIIPNLKEMIDVVVIGTPTTFKKFTSNQKGALFGWSILPDQIDRNIFPNHTSINNLYLVGHWVTSGIGQGSISLVALCGRNTAKLILRDLK